MFHTNKWPREVKLLGPIKPFRNLLMPCHTPRCQELYFPSITRDIHHAGGATRNSIKSSFGQDVRRGITICQASKPSNCCENAVFHTIWLFKYPSLSPHSFSFLSLFLPLLGSLHQTMRKPMKETGCVAQDEKQMKVGVGNFLL